MAHTLIVVGLVLIVVGALLQLIAFLAHVAVPLGVLLLVVGVIWHLVVRHQRN